MFEDGKAVRLIEEMIISDSSLVTTDIKDDGGECCGILIAATGSIAERLRLFLSGLNNEPPTDPDQHDGSDY